ncbi:PREDICTED: uncharacterized protein LOC106812297 [Priapulus caudatus]|uniref:Uncharacterized protein LOC106812297 n=1 Tax=Priapulus caudatus TaxID=37621 RepID=A0ABM1EHF2_PRICU|nr:PREDICTED: uncharacterized protein LOC106812297 [Priapulus caudatus]
MAQVEGFGQGQIHPWRSLITELMLDFEPHTLEKAVSYCKDKLPRCLYAKIKDSQNPNQTFFDILESVYGEDEMIPFLKNLMEKMHYHASQDFGLVPFKDRIAEYEAKLMQYRLQRKSILGKESDDTFVGRVKELALLRELLFKPGTHVAVICITGMLGIGKTALAVHACAWEDSVTTYRIDLRAKSSVNDAACAIALRLNRLVTAEFAPQQLLAELQLMTHPTVLYLDNVDELLKPGTISKPNTQRQDFKNILTEAAGIANPKVKLLLTSRYCLLDDEDRAAGRNTDVSSDVAGRLTEMKLTPLSHADSLKLLQRCTHIKSPALASAELDGLVQKCGHHPLSLKMTAGYMQAGFTPAEVASKLELLPGQPEQTKHLEEMFDNLPESSQRTLLQLSIFRSWFDIEAAAAVIGCHTLDMKFEIHQLKCCHLVEVDDWARLESYRGSEGIEGEARYCLHAVTRTFLSHLRRKPEVAALFTQAEQNFTQHFWHRLEKVGKLAQDNCLSALGLIENNRVHFDQCFGMMMREGTVPEMAGKKEFHKQYGACIALELFLETPRRLQLCQNISECAFKQGNKLTYSFYKAWEAEHVITQARYGKALQILEKPSGVLAEVEKQSSLTDGGKLVKALIHYVKGRALGSLNRYSDALVEVKSGLRACRALSRRSSFSARVTNQLGHVYFNLGEYSESLDCHLNAYEMLVGETGADLQLDAPTYLMNIGTGYHHMGTDAINVRPLEANEHFRRALEYYDRSLATEKKLHMDGYVKTALTVKNKAMVLSHMKRYDEALPMAMEAVAIRRRHLHGKHPDLSRSLIFVAQIYYDVGRRKAKSNDSLGSLAEFERAEAYYREAADIETTGRADHGLPTADFPALKREYLDVLKRLGKSTDLQKAQKIFLDFEAKRERRVRPRKRSQDKAGSPRSTESGSTSSSSSYTTSSEESSEAAAHTTPSEKPHDASISEDAEDPTKAGEYDENSSWNCAVA